MNRSNNKGSIARNNDYIDHRNIVNLDSNTQENIRALEQKPGRLMLSSESEPTESNLQYSVQVNIGYRFKESRGC
jgi:hypothetical protein